MLQDIERTNMQSAWKTLPSMLCQPLSVNLTIEFQEDERNEGRSVLNLLLSVCNNVPMLASRRRPGRGSIFAR